MHSTGSKLLEHDYGHAAWQQSLPHMLEFVVEAFTARTNTQHINIGTFTPKD
jgi:hypothetical protein